MSCATLVCPAPSLPAATKFTIAKWYYCIGFSLTIIVTWVLRDYAGNWFSQELGAFKLCKQSELEDNCTGKEVAMRVSFANFVFFAAHFLSCLNLKEEEDPRVEIHGGLWLWKTLIWLGTLVGFFFVPTNALYGYAQFARFGSGLFLILQLILLIDLIYKINEWLVEKDNGAAWTALIGGTIFTMCLGLALIGISYHFYAPRASCSVNIFFTTWSLIMGIVMVAILFLAKRAENAGLLTTGCVFLYCTYLLFSAQNSEPPNSCIRGDGTSSYWVNAVAFFIALAAIIYSTVSAGVASRDMFGDSKASLPYRADFFHFVFATGSLYIAMLFTNWEVSPSTTAFELDRGWISTWVKMGSKWLCELLYVWTVIAPALFPDRDFGPVV